MVVAISQGDYGGLCCPDVVAVPSWTFAIGAAELATLAASSCRHVWSSLIWFSFASFSGDQLNALTRVDQLAHPSPQETEIPESFLVLCHQQEIYSPAVKPHTARCHFVIICRENFHFVCGTLSAAVPGLL